MAPFYPMKESITYEDIVKQDELLDQFPAEEASPEEVSAWLLKYRATVSTSDRGLVDIVKTWNGYELYNLELQKFQLWFGNLEDYFIEAVQAGKMRRKIAKARRSKEYFEESRQSWESMRAAEQLQESKESKNKFSRKIPELSKW